MRSETKGPDSQSLRALTLDSTDGGDWALAERPFRPHALALAQYGGEGIESPGGWGGDLLGAGLHLDGADVALAILRADHGALIRR